VSAVTDCYIGKLVFVERENPDRNHSGYNDGEYIITQQTPGNLYGISLREGFSVYGLGGHSAGTQLPLLGAARYRIVQSSDLPAWTAKSLDDVEREIAAVLEGGKKAQWVESVYHRARTNIAKLRDLLPSEKRDACFAAQQFAAPVPAAGDVLVVVRKGTRVEVREL
jgi:hypothetical protein